MSFSIRFLGFILMLAASAPAEAAEKKLVVLGDSLVAGYNLKLEEAFPARLESKLRSDGYDVKVINAGVSGDTTSGGLARLDWVLEDEPDYAIVSLGANDMLRAINPAETRRNLEAILKKFQERKIPVLLAGMKSFRNLGDLFGGPFERMYKDLAKQYDAVYYPFFLEGVAFNADLNLADGMHPNAKGVDVIVENIYDDVKKLLKRKRR